MYDNFAAVFPDLAMNSASLECHAPFLGFILNYSQQFCMTFSKCLGNNEFVIIKTVLLKKITE